MNGKIMNRPDFTKEQEDWLCEAIGEWYLSWKTRIAKGEHRLGYAKEELKSLICGEQLHSIGCLGMMSGFVEPREFMDCYAQWDCMICGEKRHDKYISVAVHKVGLAHGFEQDDHFVRNIKYCNDRQDCMMKGLEKRNWIVNTDSDKHKTQAD